MQAEPATVFLIDDDAAVRDALELTLTMAGLDVEAYASAEAFLQQWVPGRAGCLVLDVEMPGMSGLQLQQALAARDIRLPILFLSGHGDIPMAVRALKAGAVDFLPKPCRGSKLLERVREALALDAVERRESARRASVLQRFERLTPREREVMEAVVSGQSSKEVARDLGLSYRTVEIHRARVMDKMTAGSLPELVAQGVVCGLLDLPGQ